MAFFKFRKAPDDGNPVPVQPPSVESIRQRAKYRLAGATVLVLLGVIGFPLLFDKQPRPIALDTPIRIPEKEKVLPLAVPAEPASAPALAASSQVAVPNAAVVVAASAPREEVLTETTGPAKLDAKSAEVPPKNPKAASAAATTTAPSKDSAKAAKPVVASEAGKVAEAARVQSLLDGQSVASKPAEVKAPKSSEPASAASSGRFIVQVGAFADEARAHEVRLKLERAGLKTYTHVADTKDGKRIRVRVGPFSTKAEAAKVTEKIKKLSLSAAILSL